MRQSKTMNHSLTNAFEDIDCEFQPDVALKMLEESTIQYAGALLRLAALQGDGNSKTYCRALYLLEERVEQYQWALGIKGLVMRN